MFSRYYKTSLSSEDFFDGLSRQHQYPVQYVNRGQPALICQSKVNSIIRGHKHKYEKPVNIEFLNGNSNANIKLKAGRLNLFEIISIAVPAFFLFLSIGILINFIVQNLGAIFIFPCAVFSAFSLILIVVNVLIIKSFWRKIHIFFKKVDPNITRIKNKEVTK
jgi:hypothetical protein